MASSYVGSPIIKPAVLTSDNASAIAAAAQSFLPLAALVDGVVRQLNTDMDTARKAGLKVQLQVTNGELQAAVSQELPV